MDLAEKTRNRLIETGGRTSQDLGTGRIVGQVLVYLYLQETDCSLDTIGTQLGLSKASVSIAARQLEQLGLLRKVWKSGDRKNYYKSADNIGNALQQGLLAVVRQKVQIFGSELDECLDLVNQDSRVFQINSELDFLHMRISRAKKLQTKLNRVLDNPLINLLIRTKKNDTDE